jgi:hypothetical protein
MLIYNKLIRRYEKGGEINVYETNSEFKYFSFFYDDLFSLKVDETKAKKCYLELKNCLFKLNMQSEAFCIIEKCFSKYSDDIIIIFEMLKQCITVKI